MSSERRGAGRVVTIRDPHHGMMLASGRVGPGEDDEAALVRIFREAQGPDAPEFEVLSRTAWPEGVDRRWEGLRLVVVAPGDDPRPERARVLLGDASEREAPAVGCFPMDRGALEEIRRGETSCVLVPVREGTTLRAGDIVTFEEAAVDPFGNPELVPGGASVRVALREVRKETHRWVGQDLYQVEWDPGRIEAVPDRASGPRGRGRGR